MFKKKSHPSTEVDSLTNKKRSQTSAGFFAGGVWYHPDSSPEEERNLARFGRKNWIDESSTDDDLLQTVCEKIVDTKFVKNKEIKLSITDGRVYISGKVDNLECKQILEEIIKGIPGVRGLVNDLWIES